ncbi:MAG: tetratricopeptide repeat protein [Acidobacteriota bacterium]|nr:tetratricopeptide repeat protein [Acidobacteriota bacterium]
MDRNIALALAGGFVVGAAVGYFVGVSTTPDAASMVIAAGVPQTQPPTGVPLGAPPSVVQQQAIANLERTTLQDPKNREAWVGLGNAYFDAQQPQKSVEAYAKALALKGDDPDVLTDQGVMFRELHQPAKALANFEKAQKLNPQHLPSLFNMGIVYASDLNQPAEAEAAWNKLIALAPTSQQATQARKLLAELKAPAAQ